MRVYAMPGSDELEWTVANVPAETSLLIYEYKYDTHNYEGRGFAVAVTADGHVRSKSLAHDSCCGPTEGEDYSWTDACASVAEWLARDPETGMKRTPDDCDAKFVAAVRMLNG